MGYTTDFDGQIKIVPALNEAEIAYLNKFAGTRRMDREKGPYFVDGTGFMGQGPDDDVRNHNAPPAGQPGLWCKWVPTDDGAFIEWDGCEKFDDSAKWMQYIIDHFLKPDCAAAGVVPGIVGGHYCNGMIYAQGESPDDMWRLVVMDNVVTVQRAVVEYV